MGSKAAKKAALDTLTKTREDLEKNLTGRGFEDRNDAVIEAENAAKAAGVRFVSHRGWNYEI